VKQKINLIRFILDGLIKITVYFFRGTYPKTKRCEVRLLFETLSLGNNEGGQTMSDALDQEMALAFAKMSKSSALNKLYAARVKR
jgi:hypothetical protein